MPRAVVRHPRGTPLGSLVTAVLVAGLTLTACGPGGDDPPSPGNPDGDAAAHASPSAGSSDDAARTGNPPELHGERALAVQPGRMVFVQPSCTPDPDGQRFCWGETGDPIKRDGTPMPVTLTDAVMRLDDLGLEWSVRLTFAAEDALAGAAGSASRAGDDGRVLLLEGADLLRPLPPDAVTGRTVALTGLEKDDAWDLVELVGGE